MPDAPDASDRPDDLDLAIRMMEKDETALLFVIERYGPKVMGALKGRYANRVPDYVLEDALNRAAFTLWREAGKFDENEGTLGGLFYTCAAHEVVNILREGEKISHLSLEAVNPKTLYDAISEPHTDDEITEDKKKLYNDLQDVIDALPEHQRIISEMDLYSGCDAANDYLAEMLRTSKASVYVSRNKARHSIKQEMKKRGYFK